MAEELRSSDFFVTDKVVEPPLETPKGVSLRDQFENEAAFAAKIKEVMAARRSHHHNLKTGTQS